MNPSYLVVCPGFHPQALTQGLLQALQAHASLQDLAILVMPTQKSAWRVLSGYEIRQFLYAVLGIPRTDRVPSGTQLIFLAFSAGCVGAATTARHWHLGGGTVKALFAVDGWGVPLVEPYPVYRLSHDHFTHQTSRLLGSQQIDFYADPSVPHHDLWHHPDRVMGWQVTAQNTPFTPASSLPPSRLAWSGPTPILPLCRADVRVAMTADVFIQTWLERALDRQP